VASYEATPSLISLIEMNGLGLYGVTIFKGPKAKIPVGAGKFLSINPTGGGRAEGVHDAPDRPYRKPSWQLVTVSDVYDTASSYSHALWRVIRKVRNTFIDDVWWRETEMNQEPSAFGLDDTGRPRVVFNFDATVRLP
jgi:hypothetical protein